MTELYAISLRQPWAALVAAGRKTVEIRTWPTGRRGPILIHASKTSDERPEVWKQIDTPELNALAELRGGVIAKAELTDCRFYSDAEAFALDAAKHYNDLKWFRPPGMYGFVFASVEVIPYFAAKGNTNFFRVKMPVNRRAGSVSDRSERKPPVAHAPGSPKPSSKRIVHPPEGKRKPGKDSHE